MRRAYVLAAVLFVPTLLVPTRAHALTYAAGDDNIAYLAVHQLGYDGSGVITAVINASFPRQTHQTFYVSGSDTTSRVTRMDWYGGDLDEGPIGHANSVAGTLAGRGKGDGTYLGVAPGAEIWAASCDTWDNVVQALLDFSSVNDEGKSCQIYVMPLATSNTDNGQTSLVKFLDWLATDRDVLIALGAGNNPGEIWIPGGAYNHLTVGGLTEDLLGVGNISGQGPTADGRSKPDVLAPATNLYLPAWWGDDTWRHGTDGQSWTSNAAPFAAGVAALLRQYGDDHGWDWDPRVAKSVIMNSATKLPGWTHTDTQPLDDAQGAGRLDALQAYYQYAAGEQNPGSVNACGWDLDNVNGLLNSIYDLTGTVQQGDWIAATLAWYRYTALDDDNNWITTKFENLDLYLYRDSDNALVARSISTLDSVEHVWYHVEQTDSYRLEVDLVGGAQVDETYGLSWCTQVPEPATVTLVGLGLTVGMGWLRRRRK